jgi:hypothetical protein
MIKTIGITAAITIVGLCGCASTSDNTESASPPVVTSSANPACTVESINDQVFTADAGASSITCAEDNGVLWAGGNTGPTAAGDTGTYVAKQEDGKGWKQYLDKCGEVPDQLQQYCTPRK